MNGLIGLIAAPFLLGVINRTKAFFAGRKGPSVLQTYFDLYKLLHKGAVYSRATTWIFRAGPIVGLASVMAAIVVVPFGGGQALIKFPGDLFLFAYLLGLMRFITVLAALDTGSSFEGMGASREVTFSALTEPALLLSLAVIGYKTGVISLSEMMGSLSLVSWSDSAIPLMLVCAALFIVLLAENSRIPFDDPNTHLELTMIHEVMVLDHSGPDLAFILYGASLKLWILGSILVGILLPLHSPSVLLSLASSFGGMIAIAVIVGVVESCMARLPLIAVPRLLIGANALSLIAFMLVLAP